MTAANGTALAARIARLEQLVSSIIGQVGGGEQLSPNYLTVSPTGQVGASFTGQISAQGVTINASATPSFLNQVRWQRTSDGALLAFIQGSDEAPGGALVLRAEDADQPANPETVVALFGGESSGAGNNGAFVTVSPGAPNTMTVLDDLGRSSYVQLGETNLNGSFFNPPQSIRADVGFCTVVWPGGSPNATPTTVTAGRVGVNVNYGIGGALLGTSIGLATIPVVGILYGGGGNFQINAYESSGNPAVGSQILIGYILFTD